MAGSASNRFVEQARQRIVTDEFYETYCRQMQADSDQFQSVIGELSGDEADVLVGIARKTTQPLSRVEFEEMLRGMREEQRIALARVIGGDWW
jgi:hypothetical protein